MHEFQNALFTACGEGYPVVQFGVVYWFAEACGLNEDLGTLGFPATVSSWSHHKFVLMRLGATLVNFDLAFLGQAKPGIEPASFRRLSPDPRFQSSVPFEEKPLPKAREIVLVLAVAAAKG
jgi:hypothetical protein